MKRKLQSRRGETLIETLFSMLIIVLGMSLLAGAIVTAARLNRTSSSDTLITFPSGDAAKADTKQTATIQISGGPKQTVDVYVYTCTSEKGAGKKLYYYQED